VKVRWYATARDFKQALEAQIKRRAETGGGDIVRLRQRCVFERFLARIATTFGDRVIVKGGVVLTLRLPRARLTRDIDLRLVGAPGRLKDLPDLALLASTGPFESRALRETIMATFTHRATHAHPIELPDPPASWETQYARMARENGLCWDSLAKVTDAVRAFLNPVLRGDAGFWYPDRWTWEPSDNI
jgi:hypothetical protein